MTTQPLIVDLDGTLIHTDMLNESTLRFLQNKPWACLRLPFWLSKGKAVFKQHLAHHTSFDVTSLPYNDELLTWLKQCKAEGRKLILCTASDHKIATLIAEHLNIFDEVMASDGSVNLSGKHKAEMLEQRFGFGGFDYIGNSNADLAVWQRARHAIVVNAPARLLKKVSTYCKVEQIFPKKHSGVAVWRRVLRIHQWFKNLLLFIPILAAHQLHIVDNWLLLILAFFSFSLCASSVYIANDLLDLDSDRLHPRKRNRPFASGQIPIWMGIVVAPILLLVSLLLAVHVGNNFLPWLAFYFAITCVYSWQLKRLVLVDCLTLAMLYTLRIIAGAAAIDMSLSFWLLAFSVFLFLSLAFVKRYAELELQFLSGKKKIHWRGYHTADAPLIQILGVTSGYAAVMVLALYLNSEAVLKLYRMPQVIWGAVPILLFWISWMWMQAHRGKMHDDPLIFALKDKASLIAGLAFAGVLIIGTVGWPW